jgi:rhodanese-related sulfurtransferase
LWRLSSFGTALYLVYADNNQPVSQTGEYRLISPEEAKKRLDNEEAIILLDVRTLEEHQESRISGSILIPVDDIEREAMEKLPDKDTTIFVYCRSGRRSAIAAEALINMGYKGVYDLGGIINWPYDTESGE